MKINKFKKLSSGKYKVYFDNVELVLYEEVILKYELLFDKDITLEMLDDIQKENKFYEAYHIALSYIEIKIRNKNELYKYLERKNFSDDVINEVINKIETLGLLNEKRYIESFVNDKINLSNYGPLKIKNELLFLGFNEEEIESYLSVIDSSIWEEKLNKLIDKKLKTSNNKSYFMFINKLKNDLLALGFDKELIDEKLSTIEYFSGNIDKEIEKLNKKYKNDNKKIISALFRKGYTYEEINKSLKGYDFD